MVDEDHKEKTSLAGNCGACFFGDGNKNFTKTVIAFSSIVNPQRLMAM